ncbi:hypothetical protein JCM11641_008402 [Rhodosporidiobolus odoratus]
MPSTGTAVFGYGSLIWKGPPFDLESKPGFIEGFVMRFAQKSHDHRGTPENPGRVATLVTEADWAKHRTDDPESSLPVWGRIYYISPEQHDDVWAYLDHREKDGYSLKTVDVYGVNDKNEKVVVEKDVRVYVAETDNPSFAGGEKMADLGSRIAKASGPSGPNKDYVYNLCEAVQKLDPHVEDAYLNELERQVRRNDPDSESS